MTDDDDTPDTLPAPAAALGRARRLGIRISTNRARDLGLGTDVTNRAARLGIRSSLASRAARLGVSAEIGTVPISLPDEEESA